MSTPNRYACDLLIVFVLGAGAGTSLMAWHTPQPDPHNERLVAAHRQQCSARREVALIIAMAQYVGMPVGNLDEDKAGGDPYAALAEEIYARPEWRPLAAAREIEARCLAQPPR